MTPMSDSPFIPTPEQGMHFEFLCDNCKETYIGEDGNDTEHGECGGKGTLMGWWRIPRTPIPKNAHRPKHL
jgi:hypothetical protein